MLGLFLPQRCVHCSEPTASSSRTKAHFSRSNLDAYLCTKCAGLFQLCEAISLERLRERITTFFPVKDEAPILASKVFVQDGLIQSVIHSFKFVGMPRLARIVGTELGERWMEERVEFDAIVPVPLHRTRLAARGFNQSEEIAAGIASRWGIPVYAEHVVRRIRPTRSQSTLSIPERVENVRGAFRLTKRAAPLLHGKRVLVVDDVMTTGSTMASLAEALLLAEPKHIGFLVFAAASGA